MANRISPVAQSLHDRVVDAAERSYRHAGHSVWTNPGSQKKQALEGMYIDVIATSEATPNILRLIEVETADSVTAAEAAGQWKSYDNAYLSGWFLAVPAASQAKAAGLLKKFTINHCEILPWVLSADGTPMFNLLPGLSRGIGGLLG